MSNLTRFAVVAASMLVVACAVGSPGVTPTPSPSPSPIRTPSSSPSPTPSPSPTAAAVERPTSGALTAGTYYFEDSNVKRLTFTCPPGGQYPISML